MTTHHEEYYQRQKEIVDEELRDEHSGRDSFYTLNHFIGVSVQDTV